MSPLRVSEDLVPLTTFKAKASELIRQLRAANRPLVITRNGRAAAVLLSLAEFNRLADQANFLEAVREGSADSTAGRVITDTELDRQSPRR